MTPAVDLVIAAHDPARPVERAVASALRSHAPIRVSVIAHDTPALEIRARLGALAEHPGVRVIAHSDGIRSPAGPFNRGLAAASGRFTSVMGSDDELEQGAIDSWLALAARADADVVVARLRHAGGRAVPTPPARPRARSIIDPLADRLSYRSAPLGVVSRERFGGERFAEGLAVGEDLPYVTRIWFSGARIAYDRRGPAYLIHDDAADRSTMTPRPVADVLAFLPVVLDDPAFARLTEDARRAVLVKFLRIHVFGAVTYRSDPGLWTPEERAALRDAATRIVTQGVGVERLLSRHDRTLLEAALDERVPAETLIAAAHRRRRRLDPGSLLTRSPRDLLRRDAPLRFAAASALQLR